MIEEYGDVWTEAENIIDNGPYVMAEWIHQDSMRLVKNPFWPGWEEDDRTGNVDEYHFVMIEEASTEFAMYDSNELDDSTVPLDQMDVVFNAADSQWRTPKRLGYAAQLTVHFFAKFIVDKKPLTILRRKHKMDGDVGQ